MTHSEITTLILTALETANEIRPDGKKLDLSAIAPIFGHGSLLDSLGLVALLIDIEEALAARGAVVSLSDDRALSQRRSPYRDVPSLAHYIAQSLADRQVP